MPDREKVIDGLCGAIGLIHAYVPKSLWADGYEEQACRDAIALLKEREPVIPILRPSSKGMALHCGACDWKMIEVPDTLSYEYARAKIFYCANCGRKVKWN